MMQLPAHLLEKMRKDKTTAFKQEWKEIGSKSCFFRSKWEFRYALYLELLKSEGKITDWQHEPTTFWFEGIKRGVCSYKPDFRVVHLNGSEEYIETKGFMDSKSITKIKRMAKYHPNVKLRLIQKEWFIENNKKLKKIITQWE